MSEQPTVQAQSNVLGILSIVFAILGIFFLGIVFVPLAFLCAIAATYQACLLYTSQSPRDTERSRFPSSD